MTDTTVSPVSTEPRWLDEREQGAWRAYLAMTAKLTARLNREIQEQAGISIADFSVLVQLSEHPDARMRVLELARALDWEKSRLSHQLTRMQHRELVKRVNCDEDRRGAWIELTDAGRRTVEDAAPRHVESVRHYLFDLLTGDQVDALGHIASLVVDAIEPGCEDNDHAGTQDRSCGADRVGPADARRANRR